MVWFTFAFLLGIPNSDKDPSEDIRKDDNSHIEIEVSKPNFSCHIEYVLTPGDTPKFIDVVCWSRAAKIYFEHSTSAIIPLQVKNLQWIHFRVNHNVKLKLEDIPLFRLHNIKFTVSLENKKLGEPAKSDKVKKFYGPKFPNSYNFIQKQIFQPLSETLGDLQEVSFLKEHLTPQQQLYVSLETTLETSESYGKLYNALIEMSNEFNDETCLREPSPPLEEPPPLVNILQQNVPDETESLKKKKDKKAGNKPIVKTDENEKIEFLLTGEQFLSGKKTFKNCLKYNSKELPYIICLATIKDVLSKAQANLYNPMSIVISSLNNLPVEQLRKVGINKIKFRFFICNHLLAESSLIPIQKKMKINHARTIFTNAIDQEELIHFIQTKGLNIEILANLGKNQSAASNIQKGTRSKNTKNPNGTEEIFVTLGKVSADISPILLQPHRVVISCSFQMSNDNDDSNKKENNIGFTSTNEFNYCQRKRRKPEYVSFSCSGNISSPVLKIAARLGHPLIDTWHRVTMNPCLFNRLVVVFYNEDLAIPIIQMIQDEIDETLGFVDYVKNGKNIKRPLSKHHNECAVNVDYKREAQMTGFLIDCVDKILIYAESPIFGRIQRVWAYTSCMNPLQGHVLYDSSLIFLDRLYENFFKFGGFIGITLKEPLHMTLTNSQCYINQSIPTPAWEALRCLSLLTDCKSIKAAMQNKLLPDFNSLVSLAIEFGSPIHILARKPH